MFTLDRRSWTGVFTTEDVGEFCFPIFRMSSATGQVCEERQISVSR